MQACVAEDSVRVRDAEEARQASVCEAAAATDDMQQLRAALQKAERELQVSGLMWVVLHVS